MERKVLVALDAKELNLLRGLNSAVDEAHLRYNTALGFVAAREAVNDDPDARFDITTGEFYLDVEGTAALAPEDKPEVVGDGPNDNG